MNKTLSKSKNKKIVGGNKFTFGEPSFEDNRISFEAKEAKGEKKVTLIFYKKKKDTRLNINVDDINDDINLKIITSNITDAKYYEPNMDVRDSGLPKDNIVEDMNKFDTCVIVVFEKICYIFLYVYTSGNGAIKEFDNNSENNNLKVLNALTKANFKELGLDIKFVNKFVAVVNGFVDAKLFGQSYGGSRKKINNYKILNNLILILSKINKVKNLTKTKTTKPTKPKVTKPTKPKATKPTKTKTTKPTKPKVTKPTKPKATKPTKPKATKLTKPKATKPIKQKAKKLKATKKI